MRPNNKAIVDIRPRPRSCAAPWLVSLNIRRALLNPCYSIRVYCVAFCWPTANMCEMTSSVKHNMTYSKALLWPTVTMDNGEGHSLAVVWLGGVYQSVAQ